MARTPLLAPDLLRFSLATVRAGRQVWREGAGARSAVVLRVGRERVSILHMSGRVIKNVNTGGFNALKIPPVHVVW